MGQEFHVVRCFKCQSFQVQQVKKSTRWSCKLCGEKQSLLKEFGRGSGADCRRHVQKLNTMRGAVMEEQEHHTWSLWEQVEGAEEYRDDQVSQIQVSRWSKYLNPPEEVNPEEENVLIERLEPNGNNMSNRKRKRSCTPEQLECCRLNQPGPPSQRTTSLNQPGPPSLRTTSLNQPGPPSQRTTSLNQPGPPSLRTTSLNRPGPPSLRTTSLNQPGPPSQRTTSLNQPGPSSLKTTSLNQPGPSSLRTTSLNQRNFPRQNWPHSPNKMDLPSRWNCFLPSD